MSQRAKFSISPDDLTADEPKLSPFDMDDRSDGNQSSRFRVAKVDFNMDGQTSPGNEDGHHEDGLFDAQVQKTFGRNTLETLPHIDHYRNLLSTTGGIRSRPTLLELHDLEAGDDPSLDYLCDPENAPSTAHQELTSTISVIGGAKFGWIQGVLVRCVLNIFGVMLFLRLTWVVGQAGIGMATAIILLSSTVTTLTSLSMSAISTNGVVKGGGAYYMISRSLGPEYGGAIGIVFSLANAVAVAMYVVGFAETIRDILLEHNCLMVDEINDVRIIGIITAIFLLLITLAGMGWEAKAQLVLLVLLLGAIVNFMIGTFIPPNNDEKAKGFVGYNTTVFIQNLPADFRGGETFFSVFAIFFPAATGILAGANISGDLKDAQKSIPKGTLLSILLTTLVYLLVAWMSGSILLRDAFGPMPVVRDVVENSSLLVADIMNSSEDSTLNFLMYNTSTPLPSVSSISPIVSPFLNSTFLNGTLDFCNVMHCRYGLHNDMQAMQMVSAFGPITIAGIVSATLSSALASLVSAPKVFQAVCKDKIFPGIEIFGRGYGEGGEPRLAYLLAFLLALACICIGELNAIAPLISNFFLMSYALVNYSCFDASLAKSPGWRPSFKYYSMWLSLIGAILCIAVMFVINWWTALITFAIVSALYVYVHYRKPDINWGSSTQAHVYKDALQNTQKLVHVDEHVKNYRPQILVLSGFPQDRVPLVDFCSCITRNLGLLICGHVVLTASQYKLMDLRQWTKKSQTWLMNHKTKSFYCAVAADSIRRGVQSMLQSSGLGKLRPNMMFLGFKSDWNQSTHEEVLDYFSIIHDAFDLHYGVGILRLASGLDFSHLILKSQRSAEFSNNNNMSTSDSNTNIEIKRTISCDEEDDDDEDGASKSGMQKVDDGMENCSPEKENLIGGEVLNNMQYFYRKQSKGFIDVWWLFDDGGLTLLIPYLLSTKKLWKNCKLRVYIAGRKKSELDRDQRQMAALLSKFRIQYSSLVVLPDIEKRPSEESIAEFSHLIANWSLNSELKETEETHPWKITDGELIAQNSKTYRHLRLKELLIQHSSEAKLIVMTLPMPRRGICSAGLYMAWIDTLTSNLPPILLLRGNQENVLTFYS